MLWLTVNKTSINAYLEKHNIDIIILNNMDKKEKKFN